jgi:oligosaccharide repeat unit polymerase
MPYSYLLTLGFAAAGLSSFWISRRVFYHALSPFSVFFGVWFASLFLWSLHLIDYIRIRPNTWLLLAGNMAAFGTGWLLAWLAVTHRPQDALPMNMTESISANKLFRVILIFFAFGIFGLGQFLYRVNTAVGLSAYIQAPQEIREAMALGGTIVEDYKMFNWLNVANVVLAAFYVLVLRGPRKILASLILVVCVLSTVAMEDRTRFFFAVLWTIYVLAHARRWRRKTLLLGVGSVVLMLAVQFFAVAVWLGKVAENNPELSRVVNIDSAWLPVLTAYIYVTGSLPAFQAYVDSHPASTHGSMTFYPIFKAINLFDPTLKPPEIVAEPVYIPSEFNVFTWLHQFYTDFGVFGVIAGPLLVGLGSGILYSYMRRSHSFFSVYANGLLCFGLTLSIMVNHLTQGPVWYFMALGPIITWVIRRKPLTSPVLNG